MFGTDQDPTENHNPPDETPPVSGSADDAPQTAGEDPAVTPDQPGRRKKRTRAEMEAARAAGEVPPKRDRRASADAAASVEEPAPAAPAADTHVNITLNPIDGKLTAEAINAAAAAADPTSKAMRAIVEHVEREVFTGTASDRQLGSNNIDTKSIAKARLKVYGKYAARARAAAKLWPNDPARYFDVVGKIFTDLAYGETKVDALRHDRLAVTDLVMGLLPKSTLEVIDLSGITAL